MISGDKEEKSITVGKNQNCKSLKEALDSIPQKGIIYLEPGVYKEHVNFDKEVKLVGVKDSIMNKSSSDLPIVVLDSTQSCEISAEVEIEGVVFTHKENLSFDDLQSYADTKCNFNKKPLNNGESCLLINSDSKLKNIAVLDSLTYGIIFANTNGTVEDSIISHCYDNCIFCSKKTEAILLATKIVNSRYIGVKITEYSNPSLKDCEIYGHLFEGIGMSEQSNGTFLNCNIHNNESFGITVQNDRSCTYENCNIHNNEDSGIKIQDKIIRCQKF